MIMRNHLQLPTNCIVESKDFHNKSKFPRGAAKALLFCRLAMDRERPPLDCPPAFKYLIFSREAIQQDSRSRKFNS